MKSILFIFLAALSLNSYAESKYVCKSGNVERIIEVVYSSPDSKVPCDVKYTKSDSAEVLWSAQNETGYCESKSDELALKLENLGWVCLDRSNE